MPSDNNAAAEHLVTSRKISGGTRSGQGTDSKMTLASLFGTWRARGLNPLLECRRLLASPQIEHLLRPLSLNSGCLTIEWCLYSADLVSEAIATPGLPFAEGKPRGRWTLSGSTTQPRSLAGKPYAKQTYSRLIWHGGACNTLRHPLCHR